MYYIGFIVFVILLFSGYYIFAYLLVSCFILISLVKKEFLFSLIILIGVCITIFNYRKNINLSYKDYKEKFINSTFLITDFSEFNREKRSVAAFPFLIIYSENVELYRGQLVEVSGFLKNNKIYASEIIVKEEGNILFKIFYIFRQKIFSSIEMIRDENFKALIYSFVIGNKTYLDYETKENFRLTGLMHLLALSGLHVGIIAYFVNFIFSFFFRKRVCFVINIVFLIFYIVLSGFSPSVLRASLMFILFNYFSLNSLKVDSMDVLLFSAYLSLLVFPEFVFSLGFWLSYLAFSGILLLSTYFEYMFFFLPYFLKKSFSITLSANIMTFPLILYYFGSINFISLVSNLIVIPLFSIFLILLFLNYFFYFIFVDFSYDFYFLITQRLWDFLKNIVELFSFFPFTLKVEGLNFSLVIILYLVILLLMFSQKIRFYIKMKKICY